MKSNSTPELGKFIEQYGGRIGATPFKVFILRIGPQSEEEALISVVNIDHPADGKVYRYKKNWTDTNPLKNNYTYVNQDLEDDHPNTFPFWSVPGNPQQFKIYLKWPVGITISPLEHQAKLEPQDLYARYIRQKAGEPEEEQEVDSFSKAAKNGSNGIHPEFTPREVQVMKKVALGYSCKEVSQQLFISSNTVNTHKKKLFSKIGVNNNAGLVIYAIKNGYLNDELNIRVIDLDNPE